MGEMTRLPFGLMTANPTEDVQGNDSDYQIGLNGFATTDRAVAVLASILASAPTAVGGVTPTIGANLYVAAPGMDAATNYSIYVEDGDMLFGNLVGIGTRLVTADANGVLGTGTVAGGVMQIGDVVNGADPNVVLFTDGAGNLDQNTGLTFIPASNEFRWEKDDAGSSTYFIAQNDLAGGAAFYTQSDTYSANLEAIAGNYNALTLSAADANHRTQVYSDAFQQAVLMKFAALEVNMGIVDPAEGYGVHVNGVPAVTCLDGTQLNLELPMRWNNQVVSASVATPSTHKVKINVGGTDYYFLVTT